LKRNYTTNKIQKNKEKRPKKAFLMLKNNERGQKMIQVETNSQYRRAWEKRLQLEKRIKEFSRKNDVVYLDILKRKMRKYANKETTKTDIYCFILVNNHKF
jgi:hypothetical protein